MVNENMSKFLHFKNLTQLRLTNNEDFYLDFYDGVLPILIESGAKLVSLLLSRFTKVDVTGRSNLCYFFIFLLIL